MNKARRKQLDAALQTLAEAAAKMAEARAAIAVVRDDEQEVFDNMSEGAQQGENGEAVQACVTAMEEALDDLDAVNLAEIATKLAACEVESDLPAATLSEAQAETRRQARLPDWAKTRIGRLETELAQTQDAARNMFAEADPDKKQFIIDDYDSPTRGRALPAQRIVVPSVGLRIEISRRGKLLEITKDGFGLLKVLPQAANSIMVGVEDD